MMDLTRAPILAGAVTLIGLGIRLTEKGEIVTGLAMIAAGIALIYARDKIKEMLGDKD